MEIHNKKTQYLYYHGQGSGKNKHNHLKRKIGVSGASQTDIHDTNILDQAKELGREIVRQGGTIITGTNTGFPLWSAMGAKEEKGISIGISPAASEKEHRDIYRLPTDHLDIIIYSGFGASGRDLLLARSCDALILGPGRIGSLHEFSVACENNTPIGILEGTWIDPATIREIIERAHISAARIVFDKDPKMLVEKLMQLITI
jgi:hypothetical protein